MNLSGKKKQKTPRKAAALSGVSLCVLWIVCKNLRDLVDSLCKTANLSGSSILVVDTLGCSLADLGDSNL